MAYLVSDLIGGSFLDMGAVAAGEAPNSSEQNDALIRLNQLIDSLNAEGATLPARQIDLFALTSGVPSFTLGPSGSVVTVRPTVALAVRCYLTATGQGRGLRVITDPKDWAALAERGTTFTLPLAVYPDYQVPNVTLHFSPTPTVNATVVLDILESFSTFAPDTPTSLQQSTQSFTLRSSFTMTLTANQSIYQVGPTATGTGAVVRTRPSQILAASAGFGSYRHPIDVIGSAQWEMQLEPDGTPLILPMAAYPVYAFPNATINLWPPPGTGVTAEVQSPLQMPQLATLGTDISTSYPPGWIKMLRFGLAVDLYPEYRRNVGIPPELVNNAGAAKQAVIQANIAAGILTPPPQAAPAGQ